MNRIVLRVISSVVLAGVGGGLFVGNKIALVDQERNISSLLTPPIVMEDAVKESRSSGQKMAKQIIEEGAVLLKNNGTLPLNKANAEFVNVFGWASTDWAYGANSSSCSGRVMSEDDTRASLIDFYDALTNYGIEFNPELKSMYDRYAAPYIYATKTPDAINNANVITLHEPNIEDRNYYSEELLQGALDYSDTAFVVITRNAGEDIPADRAMAKQGAGATSEPGKIYLDARAFLNDCGVEDEELDQIIDIFLDFDAI